MSERAIFLTVITLLSVILIIVLNAGTAHAVGQPVPQKRSCDVTVSIVDEARRGVITDALGGLSAESGLRFTEQAERPDIVLRDGAGLLPAGYVGLSAGGTVFLNPAPRVLGVTVVQYRRMLSRLVQHEVLHELGAVHSDDPESIMYPYVLGVSTLTVDDRVLLSGVCGG